MKPREIQLAITGAVFVLIAWHLFHDLDSVPYHGDESWWVTSGYAYSQLLMKHDFSVKHWLYPTNRNWTDILNMPVGKYFIGISMWMTLPHTDYFYIYDWGRDLQQNQALGNVPPIEVLRPGRVASALISFCTCLLMFLFCKKIWNWIVGCLAALILVFNTVFSLAAKRVMTDSFFLFFLMLTELACIVLILNATKSRRFLVSCIFAGAAAAFCASVKVNGLVLYLHYVILFTLLCVTARNDRRRLKLYFAGFVLLILISACTTIVVNPFLYSWSPKVVIARYLFILSNWHSVFAHHQSSFAQTAIHGFPAIVFRRIFYDYFPILLFPCLIIGALMAIRRFAGELHQRQISPVCAALLLFFVNLIFFTLMIPMDWDRYYLPLLIAEVPLAAFGLFWIVDRLGIRLLRH